MAYNETLADRVRARLSGRTDSSERKMFGGLCFMINGNMCCGVSQEDLMLRVGPECEAAALALPDARPCDFTGRPMTGMVFIGPAGQATDEELDNGLALALAFVSALPPK